jgi:DNA polymerase III alpha subunit
MAGALDDFGDRGVLLFNVERILAYAGNLQKAKSAGQNSLFGDDHEIATAEIDLADAPVVEKKQRLAWERELLGMYVSDHPLSDYAHLVTANRNTRIIEIKDSMENQFVRIAGVITTIVRKLTRANQNMAFVKVEDMESNIEILIFPKVLDQCAEFIQNDQAVAVDGFISFKDGAAKILAEKMYELSNDKLIPSFEKREKKRQWANKDQPKQTNTSSTTTGTPFVATPSELIIKLPSATDRKILEALKKLFQEFEGNSNITIKIPREEGFVEKKVKSKISPSPVFLHRLSEIIGKENFTI